MFERVVCCAVLLSACSHPAASGHDATPTRTSVAIPSAEPVVPSTSETPPPAASNPPPEPAVDDCDQLFGPPANAETLCDEHESTVDADLHWQSYATTESRADVNQRYREWAARCHFEFVTKGRLFLVSKRGGLRLATHEATPVDYRTCNKKPASDQKTVIVISTWSWPVPP